VTHHHGMIGQCTEIRENPTYIHTMHSSRTHGSKHRWQIPTKVEKFSHHKYGSKSGYSVI